MESILAIIIAVVSGVLVYLVGEMIREIWLLPLQQFKQLKCSISYNLVFYANKYTNLCDRINAKPDEFAEYNDASLTFRKLASELSGFIDTLAWFKPSLPKVEDLRIASKNLMAISNNFFYSGNPNQCISTIDRNIKSAEYVRKHINLKYDPNILQS